MWTSRFKGQILEKAEWQTTCVAKEQKSHLFNVLGSPTSCPHPLFSCHGRRLQVNIVLSWPYLFIIHLGIVFGWRVFKQLHVRKCPLGYKIMKGKCTVLYKLPFGSHKLSSAWRCLLVVLDETDVYSHLLSNRQQGCSLCLWEVCGACLSFQDYLLRSKMFPVAQN